MADPTTRQSNRTDTDRKTIVDSYLDQIQAVKQAKIGPDGLDPECSWFSVNALVLFGILKCSGSDSQKAQAFYRVIQPEFTHLVLVYDKDIKMAVFFLTSLATILESAQIQLAKSGATQYEPMIDTTFKLLMHKYEKTFDLVSEDFNNSMFGLYSNSVTRK